MNNSGEDTFHRQCSNLDILLFGFWQAFRLPSQSLKRVPLHEQSNTYYTLSYSGQSYAHIIHTHTKDKRQKERLSPEN